MSIYMTGIMMDLGYYHKTIRNLIYKIPQSVEKALKKIRDVIVPDES
jgi:hypothetical protein